MEVAKPGQAVKGAGLDMSELGSRRKMAGYLFSQLSIVKIMLILMYCSK